MILYDTHIPLTQFSEILSEEMIAIDGRNITKKAILEAGARALFVRSVTQVNDDLISGTGIRFVGTTTAGYEHVDIESLRKRGIAFAHAPGSNAMPVVEFVFFALHEWSQSLNAELKGKTIGIIGMGEIGKRIAKMCKQLGMHVLASDPPLEMYGIKPSDNISWTSLETLCKESDCITIHSALTDNGFHPSLNLVNERYLSLTKPGALLIQASRGGIVNEQALLNALNEQDLHLAIDVWSNEPRWNELIANHPRAFMTTPHIAGYTSSARKRGVEMIIRDYCDFLGKKCEISPSKNVGISIYDASALSLIRNRRFSIEKQQWLKYKEVNPITFDAGRKAFMQDEETLGEILNLGE